MENKKFYTFYRWLFFTAFLPYIAYLFPDIIGEIAGFNITGWSWLIMLLVSSYYAMTFHIERPFPVFFWLPWIVYMLIALSAQFSFYGLQLTFQYSLPVLVGFVASGFTYDKEKLHWLYKTLLKLGGVIGILYIYGYLFNNNYTPFSAYSPMFLSIIAALSIGTFYITKNVRFLLVYAVFFLVPFFDVTRMALLVFLFILVMHFANRNLISKFIFSILGVALALFIFNSKGFQEKTFFGESKLISDLESNVNYYDSGSIFNTSGRAQYLKYYEKGLRAKPLFGNGPRADLHVLDDIKGADSFSEAHNDYIAVRYNYGYFGLGCLLFGYLSTFVSTYLRFAREKNMYRLLLQSTVLTLTLAFLMAMYTENMLKSTTFFNDFYFAMLGMIFAGYDDKV